MKVEELRAYQDSSVMHKNMIDALINLGFEYDLFKDGYQKPGWGLIRVKDYSRWSDLLAVAFHRGEKNKAQKIKSELGL